MTTICIDDEEMDFKEPYRPPLLERWDPSFPKYLEMVGQRLQHNPGCYKYFANTVRKDPDCEMCVFGHIGQMLGAKEGTRFHHIMAAMLLVEDVNQDQSTDFDSQWNRFGNDLARAAGGPMGPSYQDSASVCSYACLTLAADLRLRSLSKPGSAMDVASRMGVR